MDRPIAHAHPRIRAHSQHAHPEVDAASGPPGRRRAGLFPALLAPCLLLLGGCPGPGVTDVYPKVIEPGMELHVTTDRPAFDVEDVAVTVGGAPAPVIRAISATEALVLAPVAAAGDREVAVELVGRPRGAAAAVRLLPPPAVQLIIEYQRDQFALAAAYPRAGGVLEEAVPPGPLLSFDVLDDGGGLVFTNVAQHPTRGRMEASDPTRDGPTLRLVTAPERGHLVIKIPTDGARALQLFDVPEGVDPFTAEGRDMRVALARIDLPQEWRLP